MMIIKYWHRLLREGVLSLEIISPEVDMSLSNLMLLGAVGKTRWAGEVTSSLNYPMIVQFQVS